MNGYIINPAWFYWVSVVDAIKAIMFIIAAILLIGVGIALFISMIDVDFDEDANKKTMLKVAIVGIACLIIAIFIPSKQILIEMQIAKYTTWENAEWTVDAIKDTVDYIVDAIGSIK